MDQLSSLESVFGSHLKPEAFRLTQPVAVDRAQAYLSAETEDCEPGPRNQFFQLHNTKSSC